MKKNLLIFHYSKDYGGGDVFLENLLPSLCNEYNLVLATVYPEKISYRLPKNAISRIYEIPVKKVYLIFGIFHFIHLLKKEKIDILFTQDIVLSIYARFFQYIFCRMRHITVIHANFRHFKYRFPLSKHIISLLNRLSCRMVDKFVCVSNYLAKFLAGEDMPDSQIEVIYNGIAIPEQIAETRVSGKVRVAFVGRLSYEKGIDNYLKMVERTVENNENAEFHVFGEGKYSGRVEEMRERYPDRLFYHGFVADVFKKHAMDILLMPSRDEGLPFTALNALAHGVPVIASGVGGLGEIIDDGENGILCGSGDIDSFYSSLLRLMNDVVLRRRFAKNSRDLAQNKFDSRVMCDRYLQILNIPA